MRNALFDWSNATSRDKTKSEVVEIVAQCWKEGMKSIMQGDPEIDGWDLFRKEC